MLSRPQLQAKRADTNNVSHALQVRAIKYVMNGLMLHGEKVTLLFINFSGVLNITVSEHLICYDARFAYKIDYQYEIGKKRLPL